MRDVYGVEIQQGSLIVYPARKGSAMWLTQATVERVNENVAYFPDITWNGKRYVKSAITEHVTYVVDAIRNGVVEGDTMVDVEERLVHLTRRNHILVVG